MKRHDGPVFDATVDVYRAIIHGKSDLATKPITPGAGVDPRKVCNPSKRVRNWHRTYGHGMSLRAFVRALARGAVIGGGAGLNKDAAGVASEWMANKAVRP